MTVMIGRVFKFGLALLVLLLVLGALPFTQATPALSAETSVAKYGAGANPTGNPIGGGSGYTRIISPSSASFYVSTRSELLSALTKAVSGQIIYVADSAQIDLTGYKNIVVPSGVTLASGRGRNGSLGGLIYTSERKTGYGYNKFFKTGSNVRVTGIRLRGPDSEIGSSTYTYQVYSGIVSSSSGKIEVDNCEIYNWSEAGVMVYLTREGHVHHNYMHHNRRTGLGYGVAVAGGTALVEANLFDYNRHSIMGTRDYPVSSYEARYNYVLEHANGTPFDMHGGNDVSKSSVPAGGTITIHHNTFKNTGHTPVNIRGVPATGAKVYGNWVQYGSESIVKQIFYQALNNLGLKPYVKMSVYDNWYGTASPPTTTTSTPAPTEPDPTPTPTEPAPPPPASTSNRAPLAPAAASGTVKGWAGTAYSYSTATTDPDGDTLRYTFYWGDASSMTTGLLKSGVTASAGHTWSKPGTYWIYVKATDSRGAASALSRPLVVSISTSSTAQVAPAPMPSAGDTPAAAEPSEPAAVVAPEAAGASDVEASEPVAPADAGDASNGYVDQYPAVPTGPVYWAMPSDPDEAAVLYNFDCEDGRSTTSILLNSGLAGSVEHWRKSRDGSSQQAVPGGEALPSDEDSGGVPIWAWVIFAGAGAFAVRRMSLLLKERLTQGD